MDFIYIIRTIDVETKTEEILQKEFTIMRINHTLWQNKTYKEYLLFLKLWKDYKFVKSYEDNAYCDSYKVAYGKVINNSCDINDGGVYDYVSIIKTPTNCCYPETYTNEKDFTLFKFDYIKKEYFEVAEDYNEETKWLSGK